ncbi:hypothetical protein A5731_18475 [Mycolicibacterium conceptionense]|uniref:hypothetical protein n=1 Tax=Mycolicibacterium conceptionense TaxID=451644 RepID=UPI0007EA9E50|nr:hypothetical protein [Mycolicibacterium conceptionense]OBB05358.1 hypothetical protein A5718_22775 [Mycolicibacterium conceptionense]OBF01261.1 hypothetical protein A5731_18475 [Mycolicibacterium conceptionense]
MATAAARPHPAERFGYFMATHPKMRRVTIFWSVGHLLTLWSVVAAPPAFASTMAGVLNWTGIKDTYGVPLGSYYLSVVSAGEAITQAGPDLSINPVSWARWLGNAVVTGVSHDTVVSWLQAQVSFYVFMITVALWLLRFAMSSTWLYWLATWFRPLFDVLRTLLIDLWVFPICLVLALGYGAYQMLWHGRRGLGWSIMLSSVAIGVIGMILVFQGDPLGELSGDHGLLFQARTLAFTAAQGAVNNGSLVPGADNAANLDHLTAVTADAVLRHPLQLMNFGMVVDNIGTCGAAYSKALMAGDGQMLPSLPPSVPAGAPGSMSATDALPFIGGGDHSRPAHAMAQCGAPQALAHAQQLDFGSFAVGFGFCILGLFFTFFICYVAYSYVMVCGAAFLNAFMALFAAGPAMIDGKPRQRAKRRIKEFFKHAFLVFVYVLYVSFAAVIILKTVAPNGYAAQVGMSHPVAQLMMIAIMSAVAIGLFWWLKKELNDHTRQDLVHAVHQVINSARAGYDKGQEAIDKGMAASQRGRDWLMEKGAAGGGGSGGDQGDDQPLTGQPVQGRSGVNKPSSSTGGGGGGLTESLPVPSGGGGTLPASGGAAGGAATAGGGSAAGGAAAVVAPEVVAGLAVAEKVQGGRQQHSAPRSNGNGRPSSDAPPVIDANGPQHSWAAGDYGSQAPADGRTNQPANGQQRTLPSPPPPPQQPVFETDTDDYWNEPPAPGRDQRR